MKSLSREEWSTLVSALRQREEEHWLHWPHWHLMERLVEDCMIPPLSKPSDQYFEGRTPRDEVLLFIPALAANIDRLLQVISVVKDTFQNVRVDMNFLLKSYYLVELMKADEFWKNECYSACYSKIFEWLKGIPDFEDLFRLSDDARRDEVFKICMNHMHLQLSGDSWKCHPTYVYLYCEIIKNLLPSSTIRCRLPLVFPVALKLMEDIEDENKLKGLKCCRIILTFLDFSEDSSGYELLIYDVLFKLLRFRSDGILNECIASLLLVLEKIDSDRCSTNWRRHDDVFETILNDLYLESETSKKRVYFQYLPELIKISGNSSLRWKKGMMTVIRDAIELSLHGSSSSPLLKLVLQTFRSWMEIGWKVWKHEHDYHMIILLYKLWIVAYDEKEPEEILDSVEDCLRLCFQLCELEQKNLLLDDNCFDNVYFDKWKMLKNKLI